MARKIVITSGKGGVGKTTVTANLGICLAKKSLRVALIDFDMGLNNLDVALNIDQRVVFDLIDVVEGRCRATQALLQYEHQPTLFVMPSCHNSKRVITVDQVKKLISRMQDSFDYILIDCPAGIETSFRRAVSCADECIMVATPHPSSVRDASKALQYIDSCKLLSVGIVVNRVRGDLVVKGDMLDAYEVFSLLGHNPLAVLPDDDKVNTNGVAFRNAKPYEILADNVHNGSNKMYDCTKRYKGVFGRMRCNLKGKV